MKKPLNYICLNCKKGIFEPRTNKKFCSSHCRYTYSNKQNPPITTKIRVRRNSLPLKRVQLSKAPNYGDNQSENRGEKDPTIYY